MARLSSSGVPPSSCHGSGCEFSSFPASRLMAQRPVLQLPGLSFFPGISIQSEVWNRLSKPISRPVVDSLSFALVVFFGRCSFKLSPDFVGCILQATIGGSHEHFRVLELSDRCFKFFVSERSVGFFIHNLRCFSCDQYVLFFHLWGNGGPNWRSELRAFMAEEEKSWSLVRSTAPKKTFADAVRSPPLSGANREPIGKPKISNALRNRLSFPGSVSVVGPSLLLTGRLTGFSVFALTPLSVPLLQFLLFAASAA